MSAPETVKVVLLGESGVGKTSIISQFTTNTFDADTVTSLSAQFISKTVEFEDIKKTIKFDIWDTAGQEKYRSLAKIFYKDARVIVLVYDITNSKSFEELKSYWFEQTRQNTDSDVIFAVVANKNDLYESQQVKDEDGKEFSQSIKALFASTSAKSDSGITNLFDNIGRKYFDPSFDLDADEKKAQELFNKKKAEGQRGKKANKGVKLNNSPADGKAGKKGCC